LKRKNQFVRKKVLCEYGELLGKTA